MIKKIFLLFMMLILFSVNVSAFTITYDGVTEEYSGRTVTLYVNDSIIEGDMPAIILNSRTLVPARAVFESLGAQVLWIEDERKVMVSEEGTVVSMFVDDDEAFVNEAKYILDCPAKIINDRLMIPVRFAAEALGCEVLWEDSTASVYISRKERFADIKSIDADCKEGIMTVTVSLSDEPVSIVDFVLDSGSPRIVVDIEGARLGEAIPDKIFSGLEVKSLRAGQYQTNPYITRVVLDMYSIGKYDVKTENNKVIITASCDDYIVPEPEDKPLPEVDISGMPALSQNAKDMLVVIDAGHGGADVGAVGKDGGVDVLYEKDVNLAVALYVNEYLTAAGVKTYMMRDTDVAVSLYDRPEIANNLEASLFLSVHSNSFNSEEANGTTVLYYALEEEDDEGFSGKDFAELVQKEIVSAIGTYDRGLMDGSGMYVIKNTVMPSVIAEMAFISNPDDRAKLASDECRRAIGLAMAKAVVTSLNMMAD